MFAKLSNKIFFVCVFLITFIILIIRQPDLRSRYLYQVRFNLFNKFEKTLMNNGLDPEKYWQFREKFSSGSFTRDENNVGFFATFRIISLKKNFNPLFFYQSKYLNSVDAITTKDQQSVLESFKSDLNGEIVAQNDSYVLVKKNQAEYILLFVLPISEMKKVNGMFDYLPSEEKLLENKYWYNLTYLNIE